MSRNSRARNLKKAAIQITELHGGNLPSDYHLLRSLTGIGDYTAGAIASIAFGIPVAAVDGNVMRLVSRLNADERDITNQIFKVDVKRQIEAILPKDSAGDFNQALIELGATLCGPGHAALCGGCPLAMHCEALRLGMTDSLPVKKKKVERKIVPKTLFILKKGGMTALTKRKDTGLLAGMYEIPAADAHLTKEEAIDHLTCLGYHVLSAEPLSDAKHIFTHLEWHMKAYLVSVESGDAHPFYTKEELASLPLPGAFSAYRHYLYPTDGENT